MPDISKYLIEDTDIVKPTQKEKVGVDVSKYLVEEPEGKSLIKKISGKVKKEIPTIVSQGQFLPFTPEIVKTVQAAPQRVSETELEMQGKSPLLEMGKETGAEWGEYLSLLSSDPKLKAYAMQSLGKRAEEGGYLARGINLAMLFGAMRGGAGLAGKIRGVSKPIPKVLPRTKPKKAEPIPEEFDLEGVKIAPKTKPSRLALNTKQRAIAYGIKEEFGELPEYQTMNMKAQAKLADDLVRGNPELAKKIAMGKVESTGDLRAGSVYKAVEIDALHKNDVNTIMDLSQSKLSTKFSALGQEIKALDVVDIESPIKAIRDIAQRRLESAKARIKDFDQIRQRHVRDIKTEIAKKLPTRQTWEQFIQSIRC